jgi:hypothetical protein
VIGAKWVSALSWLALGTFTNYRYIFGQNETAKFIFFGPDAAALRSVGPPGRPSPSFLPHTYQRYISSVSWIGRVFVCFLHMLRLADAEFFSHAYPGQYMHLDASMNLGPLNAT